MGWIKKYRDEEMMIDEYSEYRKKKEGGDEKRMRK